MNLRMVLESLVSGEYTPSELKPEEDGDESLGGYELAGKKLGFVNS